eukprot:maker-scaffold_2-augustus-gene-12.61-mRNA-1 protein AED:0.00 eAED:0.00 QI:78/1/1/1/0/1/2/376/615
MVNTSELEFIQPNDPRIQKYEKMKKTGLPQGAVENGMIRDGVDPATLYDELITDPSRVIVRADLVTVDISSARSHSPYENGRRKGGKRRKKKHRDATERFRESSNNPRRKKPDLSKLTINEDSAFKDNESATSMKRRKRSKSSASHKSTRTYKTTRSNKSTRHRGKTSRRSAKSYKTTRSNKSSLSRKGRKKKEGSVVPIPRYDRKDASSFKPLDREARTTAVSPQVPRFESPMAGNSALLADIRKFGNKTEENAIVSEAKAVQSRISILEEQSTYGADPIKPAFLADIAQDKPGGARGVLISELTIGSANGALTVRSSSRLEDSLPDADRYATTRSMKKSFNGPRFEPSFEATSRGMSYIEPAYSSNKSIAPEARQSQPRGEPESYNGPRFAATTVMMNNGKPRNVNFATSINRVSGRMASAKISIDRPSGVPMPPNRYHETTRVGEEDFTVAMSVEEETLPRKQRSQPSSFSPYKIKNRHRANISSSDSGFTVTAVKEDFRRNESMQPRGYNAPPISKMDLPIPFARDTSRLGFAPVSRGPSQTEVNLGKKFGEEFFSEFSELQESGSLRKDTSKARSYGGKASKQAVRVPDVVKSGPPHPYQGRKKRGKKYL